jgi:hypothetical protein
MNEHHQSRPLGSEGDLALNRPMGRSRPGAAWRIREIDQQSHNGDDGRQPEDDRDCHGDRSSAPELTRLLA